MTTKVESISLFVALQEMISLMQLLAEATKMDIQGLGLLPKVYCKTFKDNSRALEMAKVPKIRLRTKHLNSKYHHFHK